MRIKIILPLLMLLFFLSLVALPNSLNVCIPDGCSFSSRACNDSACINETIIQHLGERPQLLSATAGFQLSIVFSVIFILLFIVRKYLENGKFIITKFYVKQKFFNSSCARLFNYLSEAFSNGILHPKIY